jgi:hypothetical protein
LVVLRSFKKFVLAFLGVVSLFLITTCGRSGAPQKPGPASAPPARPNETEIPPSVAAQPADPPPSAQPSSGQPSTPAATFPSIVRQFVKLNALQRAEFSKTVKGLVLSGTGSVFQSDACDRLDDSTRWGAKCLKLVLDSGPSRVALYFDEKHRAVLAKYQKDQSVTFADCTANSVKDWGFGPIATCDMR